MGVYAILSVGVGASLGAWCRWGLGMLLNPLFPTVPLGTLVANWLGAYIMGACIALFAQHAVLTPELRVGLLTGFLGALTTFSTFSAETFTLFSRGEYGWMAGAIGAHVIGSVALIGLGALTIKAVLGN